jgi:hypothetical protein
MELSPLAKERLARLGELSTEEKEGVKQSHELELLLSQYFRGELSPEDLWRRMKALKDQGGEPMVKEAQLRLADTLRLPMRQHDFEQQRNAILALETLKDEGKYPTIELVLNSIEDLRQKYVQQKEQAYEQFRVAVERQLQAVVQEALRQGVKVNVQDSVEANVKASPQWKDFVSQHEKTCGEMFNNYMAKLRELI